MLLARSRRTLLRLQHYTSIRTLTVEAGGKRRPKQARTRFAPSPTGYLHLGSLRTAVYNYLFAKSTGGQFILRIEDTDKKRTVADAEQRLYQDLRWAGLQWDEGPDIGGPYGPYKQSEKIPTYHKYAQKLIDSNRAYRCFCSTERLNNLARLRSRSAQFNSYDRKCLDITAEESAERASAGEPHVVRLRIPKTMPYVVDHVYGALVDKPKKGDRVEGKPKKESSSISSGFYEDPILIKSDGWPTYHFASVIDDHEMNITHVIRGTEWLSSTPKHRLLYQYLGFYVPVFAHVGLLQNDKGEKLSKRDEVLGFRSFEADGIFPEALVNFVALFGWSHKLPSDVLSMPDLIKNFSLKFTKGDAIIEPTKLFFLQKRHAQRYITAGGEEFDSMVSRVIAVAEEYSKLNQGSLLVEGQDLKKRVNALLRIDPQNYTSPRDFFNRHAFCFHQVSRLPYVPRVDVAGGSFTVDHVKMIGDRLEQIPKNDWSIEKIEAMTGELACDIGGLAPESLRVDDVRNEAKLIGNSIGRYLRWALTGGRPGPSVRMIMVVLGQDVTLQRLREAQAEFETFSSTNGPHQEEIAVAT